MSSRPGTAALLMSWGIAIVPAAPARLWQFAKARPGARRSAPNSARKSTTGSCWRGSTRESDDVLAALDLSRALPEIDARHIGVMGSSFGGTNTLFAAVEGPALHLRDRFRRRGDELGPHAGAARRHDRRGGEGHDAALLHPGRERLLASARRGSLPPALAGHRARSVQSKIYPAFGVNPNEGHLLESRGAALWADDVRAFPGALAVKRRRLDRGSDLAAVGRAHRRPAWPVIVPIGARSKEHGHHLPMKTDYLLARALVRRHRRDACRC